jgi:hypothetical protein
MNSISTLTTVTVVISQSTTSKDIDLLMLIDMASPVATARVVGTILYCPLCSSHFMHVLDFVNLSNLLNLFGFCLFLYLRNSDRPVDWTPMSEMSFSAT